MPTHDQELSTGVPERLETVYLPVPDLKPYYRNAHAGNIPRIRRSLQTHRQFKAIVVNRGTHTGREWEVLCGSHTLFAAQEAGWEELGCHLIDVGEDQASQINLIDNPRPGHPEDLDYDTRMLLEQLAALPDPNLAGYDPGDLADLEKLLADGDHTGGDVADTTEPRRTLAERFGVPPMTVLDARQGYWQSRKKAWIALGLVGEIGRADGLTGGMANAAQVHAGYDSLNVTGTGWSGGTSVFDPVLTELLVNWYSAPGHRVLDPFAGGSTRGLVTTRLGRTYLGVDLRPEQVTANDQQATDWAHRSLFPDQTRPRWVVGDARNIRDLTTPDDRHDLLLTCPPYYNLEIYSDDPADLSRAFDYHTFLTDYRDCLAAATDRMASDAFAAIVTGAIRDKQGYILDLPADTTRIMRDLGWSLYQDAVLATSVNTAAIRAGRQFTALRKLTRVHQMVTVYHRGQINTVRTWPEPEAGDLVTDDDPTTIDQV